MHHALAAGDVFGAVALLSAERAAREMELLAMLMADPHRSVPLAKDAGVAADTFQQPDGGVLWLAIEFGIDRGRDKAGVLTLARHGLKLLGLWMDGQHRSGRSMLWSDASLVDFACSWFFDGFAIRRAVKALASLDYRLREAYAGLRYLVAALRGDLANDTPTTSARVKLIAATGAGGAA